MPIYAYRCHACSHEFESLVRGDTPVICPGCGGSDLDKLVALPAPQGKSKAIIAAGRQAAAREGHLSHFSSSERRLR